MAGAMLAPLWILSSEQFGRTQLIAGTVGLIIGLVFEFLTVLWRPAFRSGSNFGLGKDWSAHPLAPLVRWSEDVRSGAPVNEANGLLTHIEGDEYCPCALPSCAGKLGERAAVFKILEIVIRPLWGVFNIGILLSYTQLVSNGAVFWTNPGWAILGVFNLISSILAALEPLNKDALQSNEVGVLFRFWRAGRRLFSWAIEKSWLIRSLIVTLFTIVLGLWTVLRALGVKMTLEVACPLR
jgi:hypothetical protein